MMPQGIENFGLWFSSLIFLLASQICSLLPIGANIANYFADDSLEIQEQDCYSFVAQYEYQH